MKTHELSKALTVLSKTLKKIPDMETSALSEIPVSSPHLSNESLAVGLSTLIALSDVDKAQWKDFISENGFPIEFRTRDGSRDILGKVLTYLQNNREARNKLADTTSRVKGSTSNELQRALQILLRS